MVRYFLPGKGEKRKRKDYRDETIRQNFPKKICVGQTQGLSIR
jgi:hypothetical protein